MAVGRPACPAPAGWQWRALDELAKMESGHTPSRRHPEYWGGTIPWISIRDAKANHGREIHDTLEKTNEHGIANSSARVLPAGTVCLSRTASVGYVVVTSKPMATSQDFVNWICSEGLEPRFLQYLLLAEGRNLLRFASGAVHQTIYFPEAKAFCVCVPSRSEQIRLITLLDEAFASIAKARANAEKKLQNAREIFESYLQSVFATRGEGWLEKRLDEISTFSSGGTPSKTNVGYWNGDIPWVSGRDMKSTRLSDSFLHISRSAVDESATRLVPAGTLLVLVRGMGLVHGAQIAELMVPCAFNQDIKGIHVDPSVIPRYLLFALGNRINSSDSVLSNAAHGTLKIDSAELRKLTVPVPDIEDQQKAVSTIDLLAEETQRLESIYQKKLAALDELKQSLLHQAFRGKL
nr:restriction endonuclease subunit S [Stutzerimonas stutzeri]